MSSSKSWTVEFLAIQLFNLLSGLVAWDKRQYVRSEKSYQHLWAVLHLKVELLRFSVVVFGNGLEVLFGKLFRILISADIESVYDQVFLKLLLFFIDISLLIYFIQVGFGRLFEDLLPLGTISLLLGFSFCVWRGVPYQNKHVCFFLMVDVSKKDLQSFVSPASYRLQFRQVSLEVFNILLKLRVH